MPVNDRNLPTGSETVDPPEAGAEVRKLTGEQVSRLFQALPVWVVLTTMAEGTYLEVNQRFLEDTGFSRQEVIGRTSLEMGTWADPDQRRVVVEQVQATGGVRGMEVTRRVRDGRRLTMLFSTELIEVDGRRCLLSISQDITPLREAQRALSASERRFSSMVKNAGEGVWVLDLERRTTFVNRRLAEMLATEPHEMMGRPLRDFLPSREAETFCQDMQTGGGGMVIETRLRRAGGSRFWAKLSGSPLPAPNGETEGFLALVSDITPRKKAEREMRDYAERLTDTLESISDGFMSLDRGLVVTYCNQAAGRRLGAETAKLLGRPLLEVFPRARGSVFDQRFNEALRDRRPLSFETSFGAEPDLNWFEVRVYPQRDGIAVYFTVTTARKRAEQALRDSQERLAQIIDFLPDATFVIDREHRIIAWNQAVEQLTGIPARDMLGKGDYEHALPFYGQRRPVSVDLVLDQDAQVAASYRSYRTVGDRVFSETELPNFLGRGRAFFWNNASRLYDSQGRVIGAIESVRDVTEMRLAEEALKESEEKYRLLVENALDAIYILQDGYMVFANPMVEQICGYSPEELAGIHFRDLLHPRDARLAELRYEKRLRGKRVPSNYTMRVRAKNGETRWIQVNQVVLTWQGRPATLNIARDITAQHRLEDQLRQAQKMEAVGTLAGGIAHDFNNILSAIMGYGELAQEQAGTGQDNSASIREVIRAAERARDLVRQILTFSRQVQSDLRPLSLNRVVHELRGLLDRTLPKNIELHTELESELWPVLGDEGQLGQVLLNLATNARDAMEQGGTLTVTTRNLTIEDKAATAPPDLGPGPHVLLSVSDSGQGMLEKTRRQIFDPFFTTKGPGRGTGLGLSTVYGIIKGHGGDILCYSRPGHGTTFHIYLPAAPGESEHVRPQPKPGLDQPPGGQETLLLADDEAQVREVATEILTRAGYEVLSADSGEEALEVYGRLGERISLVILDLGMPGVGGQACLEQLVARDPEARVLVASGYAGPEHSQKALSAGAAAFVAKPYRAAELLLAVRQALDR